MSANVKVEVIHSRATGVLFFAGFGSIWLYLGLAAMHRQGVLIAAAIATIAATLILPALTLLRRTSSAEDRADAQAKRIQRAFVRVNIVQWVAGVMAVILLNVFGKGDYVVPAIATIVGLHLFPLAQLYRNPLHYLTGTLLVVWSLACVVAVPAERIAGVGATGAALLLLGSGAFTLAQARSAAALLATS